MKVTDVTQSSCPTSSDLSPQEALGLVGLEIAYMVECIVKSVIAKVKTCCSISTWRALGGQKRTKPMMQR